MRWLVLLLCPFVLGAFTDNLVGFYELDEGTGTTITADAGSNGTAISGQLVADLGDGLPGLDLGAAAGDSNLGDVDMTSQATWCFFVRPFALANNQGFLDRYLTTGNRRAWRFFVQLDGDVGGAFSSDGTTNDSFNTTAAGIVANDTTTWLCVTYDAGALSIFKDANMATAIFTDTLTQTSLNDDDLDVFIGSHSLTNADVGLRRVVLWARVATETEMACARDNGAACIGLSPALLQRVQHGY